MASRRAIWAIVALAVIVAALVWVLSRSYPTLWCSIVGACNQ